MRRNDKKNAIKKKKKKKKKKEADGWKNKNHNDIVLY